MSTASNLQCSERRILEGDELPVRVHTNRKNPLTKIALCTVQNQIRLQNRPQNAIPDRPQRVQVQLPPPFEPMLLLLVALLLLLLLLMILMMLLLLVALRSRCAGRTGAGYHTVVEAGVQADALLGRGTGHVQQGAILFAHNAAATDATVGHVVVVLVADQRTSYRHGSTRVLMAMAFFVRWFGARVRVF